MDRIEISAERAAELTLEALADAAEHCRRKARGRSLYGPQWANVRAMFRERAAEFDSLRAMLNAGQVPRPAWVAERAAKLAGESKAVQDVVAAQADCPGGCGNPEHKAAYRLASSRYAGDQAVSVTDPSTWAPWR